MPNESKQYAGLVIPMTTLALANDIAIVNVPADATVMKVFGSVRTMVSGTQTVTLKNDAGGTLGSLTWVAAGVTSGTINTAGILTNDNIHVNITSLGVSVVDCTITIWLKLANIP